MGLANGRPPFEANVATETKFIGFVMAADAAGDAGYIRETDAFRDNAASYLGL